MDANKVCQALQMTLNPDPTKRGENLLKEMHKIIGFTPLLLKISLEDTVAPEIRQSAVLYFKNNVNMYWPPHDNDSLSSTKENEMDTFSIHEDDKIVLRQNIVKAIVSVPGPLQIQLKSALRTILQHDYPAKFEYFFDILKEHLSSTDYSSLNGALLAMHAFFECHRYSQRENWQVADQAMAHLLPGLTQLMTRFLQDKSLQAYTLQKHILKSLSTYSSFHINPSTFNKEVLPVWINICCTILQDVNPEFDDDSEGIYWKNKKWAINYMVGMFDRFGNPGSVQKTYEEFAAYFFNTFTHQITNLCIGLLLSKNYISPRVKATSILYLTTGLTKAMAWKIIKPHFALILETVLHPLLCHSDEDEELWEEDPNEYIRFRCVDIESNQNPSMTAFALLESASAKRRGILQMVMEFCTLVLNSNAASEKDKDGVLHIIGAISETLLKRKDYANQLENFLVNFVFPTLRSPLRFRRARACWLMCRLSNARFHNNVILCQAVNNVYELMMNDPEKPVQVMAAQALIKVCEDQEKAQDVLKPHLSNILFKLINLLRETAFDEINELICTSMHIYRDDLLPIALTLIENMVDLVNSFIVPKAGEKPEDEDEDEDYQREETMMMVDSALTNIETILSACSEHQELLDRAEPQIIGCLKNVLQYKCEDLYESAFNMFQMLQTNKISELQWQVFDWFYEVFQNGFSEFFFEDCVNVLHQFITFDSDQFVSNPNRLSMTCNMLIHVLATNNDMELEPGKAGKLLECMLLQYRERMEPFVPKIVETALLKYVHADETFFELKTMCLQLISAALFVCPELVMGILTSHPWPETEVPMLDNFLNLCIQNAKKLAGLHDRRLFVLMVCKLLSLPAETRPAALLNLQGEVMQNTLDVMERLPSMYTLRAKLDEDSDDESDEDVGEEDDNDKSREVQEGMASDEDEVDDETQDYFEYLDQFSGDKKAGEEDLDEAEEDELTELEMFETLLDKEEHDREEFVVFYQTMVWLEQNQPEWYGRLIGALPEERKKSLAKIAETARRTIEMKESKRIEQAGGYDFKQTSVPTSFNFGGDAQA